MSNITTHIYNIHMSRDSECEDRRTGEMCCLDLAR